MMLIECAVYISLLFVVLSLSFMVFFRCRDFSIGLHRNADDITRALSAGELWRQDVRSASNPIRLEAGREEEVLHIPQRQGEVAYRLASGEVHRRACAAGPWVALLPRVKSSLMQQDLRTHVKSWRWELEMTQSRKNARVRPLFTFQAVPVTERAP